MRSTTAPPSVEANREERVSRLAGFITGHIITAAAAGSGICLIARSLDSPVAKAVALATYDAGAAIPVRAILASVDRKALQGQGLRWEIRVLRTPRLLDAHEQLTIGTASWHGDSLRRDPGRRDHFEQFDPDGGETLAWTEISFARLWAHAEPVLVVTPPMSDLERDAASLAMMTADPPNSADTQNGETLQG